MVDIYSIHGVYKPLYNVWGHHLVNIFEGWLLHQAVDLWLMIDDWFKYKKGYSNDNTYYFTTLWWTNIAIENDHL